MQSTASYRLYCAQDHRTRLNGKLNSFQTNKEALLSSFINLQCKDGFDDASFIIYTFYFDKAVALYEINYIYLKGAYIKKYTLKEIKLLHGNRWEMLSLFKIPLGVIDIPTYKIKQIFI